jgi:hypothetical protein
LVEVGNVNCNRRVRIFGTGNTVKLDGNWKFVDSVQERIFVWHVFVESE